MTIRTNWNEDERKYVFTNEAGYGIAVYTVMNDELIINTQEIKNIGEFKDLIAVIIGPITYAQICYHTVEDMWDNIKDTLDVIYNIDDFMEQLCYQIKSWEY